MSIISSRQLMRMKKISIKGLIVDPIMNSPKIRKNYVADSQGFTDEILGVKELCSPIHKQMVTRLIYTWLIYKQSCRKQSRTP